MRERSGSHDTGQSSRFLVLLPVSLARMDKPKPPGIELDRTGPGAFPELGSISHALFKNKIMLSIHAPALSLEGISCGGGLFFPLILLLFLCFSWGPHEASGFTWGPHEASGSKLIVKLRVFFYKGRFSELRFFSLGSVCAISHDNLLV